MDYRALVLAHYDEFPFHQHPLWVAIRDGRLSRAQVIDAEKQHFIRTRAGQRLREHAVQGSSGSKLLFEAALANYVEEVAPNGDHESHLELIRWLLSTDGVTDEELRGLRPTPGNAAAMALYGEIASRGGPCHLIGAGAVEYYYAKLAPEIYAAYTTIYGFTPEAAETYALHEAQDQTHASRALDALGDAIESVGWELLDTSVRDAFVATSLHYDGMLQAAIGTTAYWDGRSS